MPAPRFNHMELTVEKGVLARDRSRIADFFQDVFSFEALDVPILNQIGLLLRTDPETSQFLLVTEQREHMHSPGYDHLGFLYETRAEVDALLERCRKWQERDPDVQIKEYEDLHVADTVVHAFYVRYLLPIWFDVQVIEDAAGRAPRAGWRWVTGG